MDYLKPNWQDVSPWLVHFSDGKGSKSAYDKMMGILSSCCIKTQARYGFAKKSENCARSACLSEIPLHQLGRLAEKRKSPYGIVFRRNFIQSIGGCPILYAHKDTPSYAAVSALRDIAENNPQHPFWQLAPFVDAPGQYGPVSYFFDWEREWRVAGNIEFNLSDVAFLVIPESDHAAVRGFFQNAELEHLGPNYQCPYIDANWDWARLCDEFPDDFQ